VRWQDKFITANSQIYLNNNPQTKKNKIIMSGLNEVTLIGNVGKTPEIRTLDGGAKVANFPLATTEAYKDKNGERKEETEWHNIVAWRSLADISEKYVTKGAKVMIRGKLRTRSWEDKTTHVKRYATEIVMEKIILLSSSKNNSNEPTGNNSNIGHDSNSHGNGNGSGGGFDSGKSENDDLPF
jgi:single-strand DNA-binding protein